ncbi:MAG: sigma 54-interacting transcriptional regulator [bacterium]|nr:sigma 54-interacting transcriptional regulator [bacterium]
MREVEVSYSIFILNKFLEQLLPPIPLEVALDQAFLEKVKDKLDPLLIRSGLSNLIREFSLCERNQNEAVGALSFGSGIVNFRVPVANSNKYLRVDFECDPSDLPNLSILSISLTLALKEVHKEVEKLKEGGIVGIPEDIVMKIKKAAASNLPCLILGETGVGKEVVAELIHRWSGRRGPFVVVNCGAIPHGLFENELFGHEPNSFTGSSKTGLKGKIEIADGGTLFLDEIGEISLYSQAKLLRVIERGEFWKLGAMKPTRVDVRFIAATNRPLREFVNVGRFRKDLYFRLKGMEIVIPPLRERRELIEALVNSFLREFSGGRVYFTGDAIGILRAYHWPGNVRELKYLVQYVVDEIKEGPVSATKVKSILGMERSVCPYEEAKRQFDRSYILSALELNAGNITKTAQQLGMSRRWLQLKMNELGLKNQREF